MRCVFWITCSIGWTSVAGFNICLRTFAWTVQLDDCHNHPHYTSPKSVKNVPRDAYLITWHMYYGTCSVCSKKHVFNTQRRFSNQLAKVRRVTVLRRTKSISFSGFQESRVWYVFFGSHTCFVRSALVTWRYGAIHRHTFTWKIQLNDYHNGFSLGVTKIRA